MDNLTHMFDCSYTEDVTKKLLNVVRNYIPTASPEDIVSHNLTVSDFITAADSITAAESRLDRKPKRINYHQ